MNFTMDVGIALVVGMALGFFICRATKWFTTSDHEGTGPHKDE